MKLEAWRKRYLKFLGQYKYVLMVAAVGVLLLLWPSKGETSPPAGDSLPEGADLFQIGQIEEKLEQALSQVEGAGEVTVVLTVRDGPRQVVAQDGSATQSEGQTSRETTTVLASQGSGTQGPVALQELGPVYQGALVVSQGGDNPQVRLALSEAVSALTGLGADKISICKGK